MQPIRDLSQPLWTWVVEAIDRTWQTMNRAEIDS
jgi:hypothetical protein